MRGEGGAWSAGGKAWARDPTGSSRERPRPRGPAPSRHLLGKANLRDLEGDSQALASLFRLHGSFNLTT